MALIIPPNITNFFGVFQWVIHHGYPIMLLAMIIEGPIVTAAASFATSLGYFSLPIIFLLAFLGDFLGDIIAYGIGYLGRITLIRKFGNRFKLSEEKMENLKSIFEKHPVRTLIAIKLSPFLPVPGIIMVGSTKLSFKKFFTIVSLIIVPKAIVFMSLGYFFGKAYDIISKYINSASYAFLIIVILLVVVYYFYRKATGKISEKLEKFSKKLDDK